MTLKGIEGSKKIAEIMDNLRKNPPALIGDAPVIGFRDYQVDKKVNMLTGEVVKTGLPKSNVLYFELPNDCWCCARPSGTEPKIKFYMGVTGNSLEDSQMKLGQLTEAVKQFVK